MKPWRNLYLVWLAWPEKCFHASSEDVRYLESLVGADSKVVKVDTEKEFLAALPEATHALVWHFKREWFDNAGCLRLLATPAAGREFVPSHGPEGVTIHFGTFHGKMMAEYVLAYMYGHCRGMYLLLGTERPSDPWPRTWLSDKCTMVAGTAAVIVGFGHVGKAIGERLEGAGVSVVGITGHHGAFAGAADPRPIGSDEVGRRLQEADWLVMALPSDGKTDNLVDRTFIERLPTKCSIINVGRGNSIDERALYDALKTGRISSACLDVRKREPSLTVLETDGFVRELADLPNCMLTPHSSAFSRDYMRSYFTELKDEGLL